MRPRHTLVQVPLILGPWPSAAQAAGKVLAEFLAPTPNGFVGDDDGPLRQKQLDISQIEVDHMAQPDGMADDLGGKAVAIVRGGSWLRAVTVVRLRPDPHMAARATGRLKARSAGSNP